MQPSLSSVGEDRASVGSVTFHKLTKVAQVPSLPRTMGTALQSALASEHGQRNVRFAVVPMARVYVLRIQARRASKAREVDTGRMD